MPNIYEWFFGSPNDAAADAAFIKASLELKAARKAGDRAAEQAALSAMRKAANQSAATVNKVQGKIDAVDEVAARVKKTFKIGGSIALGLGVLVLVIVLKK